MQNIKKSLKGFWQLKKRHRNFSFVLIISYVFLVFFTSLLSQMQSNVKGVWVDSLIGGNIISLDRNEFIDFYTPASLENLFSFSEFSAIQKKRAVYAPRLRVQGLVENTQSVPVIINGVQKESELALGDHVVLDEGRWFEEGQNEIMLSFSTASTIGVSLGDRVYFTVMTSDGYPSYEMLTLVGYLSFGNVGALFGDNVAYISLPVLQNLCNVSLDEVNEIATNVKNQFSIRGNYAFHKGESMVSISKLIKTAITILTVLLFAFFGCFLLFSIVTNVHTIIKEKNKEINVYLTFGAEPAFIRKKIILEFFFYSLYCAFIGSLICILLINGFNALGFYSIDAATEMLLSSSQFVIRMMPSVFIFCFVLILALIVLGSIKTVLEKTSILSLKSIEKDY